MTELMAGALWASIAGTIVAAMFATIVAAFVRWKRPAAATRCTLWLIVLSTCVLAPAAIFGAMSMPNVPSFSHADGVQMSSVRTLRSALGLTVRARDEVGPRPPAERPTLARQIALAIAALWAAGTLVGCADLLRSVARIRTLKRHSVPLDGSLVDELPWLVQRPGREIYLRLSGEIETPIAIGFRRPVILVPTEMATLSGLVAIEPLVMHEYAHLERYDDWTNLWQRIIERFAWCNPLVWYAGRCLTLEREVAADDAVVDRKNDPAHYAKALWRLAREMRIPEHVVVAPGAMLTRKQLSIRIERLLDDSVTPQRYAGAALAVATIAACTVAVVAASAPRFAFAHSTANKVDAQSQLRPNARALANEVSATIVRSTTPAVTMRIARSVPALLPVEVLAQASGDVNTETVSGLRGGCTGCNLQNADLHGQDFRDAHFTGTNMQNADLHAANLRGAVFVGVNFHNANLDGADLRDARMTGSNLYGASMRHTLTAGMSLTGMSLP